MTEVSSAPRNEDPPPSSLCQATQPILPTGLHLRDILREMGGLEKSISAARTAHANGSPINVSASLDSAAAQVQLIRAMLMREQAPCIPSNAADITLPHLMSLSDQTRELLREHGAQTLGDIVSSIEPALCATGRFSHTSKPMWELRWYLWNRGMHLGMRIAAPGHTGDFEYPFKTRIVRDRPEIEDPNQMALYLLRKPAAAPVSLRLDARFAREADMAPDYDGGLEVDSNKRCFVIQQSLDGGRFARREVRPSDLAAVRCDPAFERATWRPDFANL